MKKKLIRIITIVLTTSILLSTFAFAAVTRESSYFDSYSADIIRIGSGKVRIEFGVDATHRMTQLGVYKAAVYTSSGGYVKTVYYTSSGCSSMMTNNASVYYNSFDIQLTAGNSYFVVLTFYATDSRGTGMVPFTTPVFTPRT